MEDQEIIKQRIIKNMKEVSALGGDSDIIIAGLMLKTAEQYGMGDWCNRYININIQDKKIRRKIRKVARNQVREYVNDKGEVCLSFRSDWEQI